MHEISFQLASRHCNNISDIQYNEVNRKTLHLFNMTSVTLYLYIVNTHLVLLDIENLFCMDQSRVHYVLRRLKDHQADRDHQIVRQALQTSGDSDDDAGAECPILDSSYEEGGKRAIVTTTNLTAPEIWILYGKLQSFIVTHWNVGRDRKFMLFMMLTTLKHGGS